jgi:hypothetical protein
VDNQASKAFQTEAKADEKGKKGGNGKFCKENWSCGCLEEKVCLEPSLVVLISPLTRS